MVLSKWPGPGPMTPLAPGKGPSFTAGSSRHNSFTRGSSWETTPRSWAAFTSPLPRVHMGWPPSPRCPPASEPGPYRLEMGSLWTLLLLLLWYYQTQDPPFPSLRRLPQLWSGWCHPAPQSPGLCQVPHRLLAVWWPLRTSLSRTRWELPSAQAQFSDLRGRQRPLPVTSMTLSHLRAVGPQPPLTAGSSSRVRQLLSFLGLGQSGAPPLGPA